MFSQDRLLSSSTRRALYTYCPFADYIPDPTQIREPGVDVGCCVDSVLNSHTRMHFHPDDMCVPFYWVSSMSDFEKRCRRSHRVSIEGQSSLSDRFNVVWSVGWSGGRHDVL